NFAAIELDDDSAIIERQGIFTWGDDARWLWRTCFRGKTVLIHRIRSIFGTRCCGGIHAAGDRASNDVDGLGQRGTRTITLAVFGRQRTHNTSCGAGSRRPLAGIAELQMIFTLDEAMRTHTGGSSS